MRTNLATAMSITPDTIRFSIANTSEMIRKAKQLCHDVYLQVGYINASYPDNIIPYDLGHASTYLVATSPQHGVVGTIRLTQGPPFTTFRVWKNRLYTRCKPLIRDAMRGNAFEIGALAVRKDFSSLHISRGLYQAVQQYAVAWGLDYGIISMDHRALRSLEMLGWVVIRIGEPMDYFGSLTVPGIMPVKEQPVQVGRTLLPHALTA